MIIAGAPGSSCPEFIGEKIMLAWAQNLLSAHGTLALPGLHHQTWWPRTLCMYVCVCFMCLCVRVLYVPLCVCCMCLCVCAHMCLHFAYIALNHSGMLSELLLYPFKSHTCVQNELTMYICTPTIHKHCLCCIHKLNFDVYSTPLGHLIFKF